MVHDRNKKRITDIKILVFPNHENKLVGYSFTLFNIFLHDRQCSKKKNRAWIVNAPCCKSHT